MRYKLDRSFFIPKEYDSTQEQENAIVYLYDSKNSKPGAIAFQGKAQKPSWHFYFFSEEQRQKRIDDWFTGLKAHVDYMSERKAKRQEEIAQADIKRGDYFSTSWGYDQTNIDYLIVVGVTAKTAMCRMADAIYVGESGTSDVLMPGTAYGDVFRMKISGKDSLVGSYPYCRGHSSKRMGYFSKTTLTETRQQTMAQFGH